MSSRNNHSFPLGLLGKIALVMLVAGGGAAWFTLNSLNSSQTTFTEVTPSIPETTKPSVIGQKEVLNVYWVKITENKTELVPKSIEVNKSNNKTDELKESLEQLLAIQNNDYNSTLIPAGTKLLDCQVDQDGIHLNLSRQFAEGGGSVSLISRLGQVIYTATSREIKGRVWLNVEGQPLEILGEGDGLMVQQPLTREKFNQDYQL